MTAVFLDLDGTLTDPKPGITAAVIHALTLLDRPAPPADELTWVIGPPLIDSFARMGVPDPAQALALYRGYFSDRGLFENTVYDGIPDALDAMRAEGHRLFLATAKPHVYARRITAHFGLDTYLEAQYGPELDGTMNDKADLLAHALARQNISPSDAVMIGDRRQDIAAARANAMPAIGVTWGYGAANELDDADTLCHAPADLPAAIRGLF
ncbi:HAD hydrolase-like protein [Psychromarinibacter sp. S121]|uniref:HAD hydrolase-like protein n=1 Tax=Psychromarinibacter sp. S121 TaxID=3415127 RepID=UPI003C7C019D